MKKGEVLKLILLFFGLSKKYTDEHSGGGSRPYLSLERRSRYLYDVSFQEAPPDIGVDSVPGLCSAYVQGGKLYRNLDWNYDDNATFHVTLPGIEGLAFINGLTDENLDNALIGQLPYHLVDGVNENGIMVSTHVLYNDWDAVGTGEIPLTYLPYVVLTRVKSMATIEDDLDGVLDNLKSTPALIASGYLIQVLVTDGVTSYVLRPGNATDATYEAVDITENAKLANFRWVPDTTVARTDLQRRPTGVERWNMMPCPLSDLRFTKAYEAPDRLSEFIGINGTDKDSTDAELTEIYNTAHALYLERERDGQTWQTMHSVVYSSKGLEHLWVQEDWSHDMAYASGDYLTKSAQVEKTSSMTKPVGVDAAGKLWVEGENAHDPMFGVSGIGGSSSTLTRLWDAVGFGVTLGTDTVAAKSDFDSYEPFNRRKCVGSWSIVDGKAKFNVAAYEGDADYTEDGTIGDYVAVEVNPFYWFESADKSSIGVAKEAHTGWNLHPICLDADGNVRQHTYLPCYALAMKDGHAVSLPGLYNHFGSYKDNWDKARTYGDGSSFANFAIIEPSIVDHYEWLLQTIEFATTDMQTVMQGATSMPYNTNHIITAAPAANKIVLTAAIGDLFSIGQTIYIGAGYSDTPSSIAAYNCITDIQKCTVDGTLSDDGTYRLITYDGTDRTSSIIGGTTKVASRPWITGATQGYAPGISAVLGHTGSPISNNDAKHPMRYRWRENAYGNQNMTCLDLMDVRVEVGSTYKLQWYHHPELATRGAAAYYPSTASKPDTSDLTDITKGWVLLGVETPTASYNDGYIKEESADPNYPCVRVPTLTTGGSSTTYYADYAYLVTSSVVRAVRRRGSVTSGRSSGPRAVYAHSAPSTAAWYYGSSLYMAQ